MTTNAWEDSWLICGHLAGFISYRAIASLGSHQTATVRDFINLVNGVWPTQWIDHHARLRNIPMPLLEDAIMDKIMWVSVKGNLKDFSVREAYKSFDGLHEIVPWHASIWFKGHIPKHSFCAWIACNRRLPTQDRIAAWKHEPPDFRCVLCGMCEDSHEHLFFDCPYSHDVWRKVCIEVGWLTIPTSWNAIMDHISETNTAPKCLLHKLSLSSSIYFIWKERNSRVFTSQRRSQDQLVTLIIDVIMRRASWKNRQKGILKNG